MEKPTGHSAVVRINLVLNGHALPVAQLGPDFLILDTPADIPAEVADIVMSVDGEEERWKVRLPEGLRSSSHRVRISHFG